MTRLLGLRLLIYLMLVLLVMSGCGLQDQSAYIDLNRPEKITPTGAMTSPAAPVLNIGLTGIVKTSAHNHLAQALEELTRYKIKIIQRRTYTEINNLMAFGSVDAALTTANAYIFDKEHFHLEAVVAGVAVKRDKGAESNFDSNPQQLFSGKYSGTVAMLSFGSLLLAIIIWSRQP